MIHFIASITSRDKLRLTKFVALFSASLRCLKQFAHLRPRIRVIFYKVYKIKKTTNNHTLKQMPVPEKLDFLKMGVFQQYNYGKESL